MTLIEKIRRAPRLRVRLGAGFGALLLLMAVVAVVSWWAFSAVSARDALLAQEWQRLGLGSAEQARIQALQDALQLRLVRAGELIGVLLLVALAFALFQATRITLGITRPLQRLTEAAHRIAAGDYSARAEVRAGDELGHLAGELSTLAAEVARREEKIEAIAFHDRLTGLPNVAMLRRIAAGQRAGSASVILFDVAGLGIINENLGHEIGDAVLAEAADRLREAVAREQRRLPGIALARMPGGAFAVWCDGLDRHGLEVLRGRLAERVMAPSESHEHLAGVRLVCGLASGLDEHGGGVLDLLRRAELAAAEAKAAGRDWGWQAPVDPVARVRQLTMLSSLRHAAGEGELELWLQPRRGLRDQRLEGLAGRLRWRHPSRGVLLPREFVPVAVRTGHAGVVTEAMLGAAMARLANWRDSHPALAISVKLSALDLRDGTLPGRIEALAARHQVGLSLLRVEFSAAGLVHEETKVLPVLHALHAAGIGLTIDDFGAGEIALGLLHRLPTDELVVHSSLVGEAGCSSGVQATLRSAIELAHRLGMRAVADGVARAEEWELLRELGCDVAQGELIGAPLDPRACDEFLADKPPVRAPLQRAGS